MNDQERIEKLINDNMSLVHTIISKVARKKKYCDYEDLFAQARLGLVLAANKFDPNRGVKFSTFAVKFVKNEIVNFKDAHSVYIDGEVEDLNLSQNKEKDDNKLQIVLDKIDALPEKDRNMLMLYFSNTPDISSILNKILNGKKVEKLVEELKNNLN